MDVKQGPWILLLCCTAAWCVAVFAYLFPQVNWNHTAAYAGILMIFIGVIGRNLVLSIRNRQILKPHRALFWVLSGTLFACLSALANGLLDQDVTTLRGSPGIVMPIPDTLAHVQFSSVQSSLQEPQPLMLTLNVNASDTVQLVAGQHYLLGTLLLSLGREASATVQAHDDRAAGLTITHPSSGAFLAPLLLFHREQHIDQLSLPFDEISIPAKAEHISAFFIDAQAAKTAHLIRVSGGQPGVLVDVSTNDGHPIPNGIGFMPDGIAAHVADLQLLITLGKYPTLIITPVPNPLIMICSFFAFVGGAARLLLVSKAKNLTSV